MGPDSPAVSREGDLDRGVGAFALGPDGHDKNREREPDQDQDRLDHRVQ
jgi:hypothetical protein